MSYCLGDDNHQEEDTYSQPQLPGLEANSAVHPSDSEPARKSRDAMDDLNKVANRLVASAMAKAVQRVIMEGRMVRCELNISVMRYVHTYIRCS